MENLISLLTHEKGMATRTYCPGSHFVDAKPDQTGHVSFSEVLLSYIDEKGFAFVLALQAEGRDSSSMWRYVVIPGLLLSRKGNEYTVQLIEDDHLKRRIEVLASKRGLEGVVNFWKDDSVQPAKSSS